MHQGTKMEARQDYLKIILDLERKTPGDHRFISNKEIAAAFHVQPPSVTDILSKLEAAGFVEWQKRRGVRLTRKGKIQATKVLDAHRLVETFLAKVLNVDDNVMNHRIACKMEHILMDEPGLARMMLETIDHASPPLRGTDVANERMTGITHDCQDC